jgi:2-polyprenyl-3-methyl-5-hydroxy-6-metoxy-1,4-benzoquinol methylase
MSEESINPCTICGSFKNSKFLFEKNNDNRGRDSINFYKCQKCKIVYLGKYNSVYDEGLYEYYNKYIGKTKEQVYDSLTKDSYLRVIKLLALHGCKQTILDVGCGNGSFVDAALGQGYLVQGIELSQSAVDIALGFNLPVSKLDFFSSQIENCSFDGITMFEVLEHLNNPTHFLLRAQEVVKPGGLIYLTTPNFNSLERRILGKNWNVFHREHLTYFTEKNLTQLIKDHTDLEILHSETRNISAELINSFISFGLLNKINKSLSNSNNDSSRLEIRNKISNSQLLTLLKKITNSLLSITALGSTTVMLLKRPLNENI